MYYLHSQVSSYFISFPLTFFYFCLTYLLPSARRISKVKWRNISQPKIVCAYKRRQFYQPISNQQGMRLFSHLRPCVKRKKEITGTISTKRHCSFVLLQIDLWKFLFIAVQILWFIYQLYFSSVFISHKMADVMKNVTTCWVSFSTKVEVNKISAHASINIRNKRSHLIFQ